MANIPGMPIFRYVRKQHYSSMDSFVGNTSTTAKSDSNTTIPPTVLTDNICQWILYQDINNSGVAIWDIMILVPNFIFAMFLASRLCQAYAKLKQTSSPVFAAFYILVWSVVILEILRCVVSMTVNATYTGGETADKVLWLIVRFFLLATEISVITFALAFGHLERWTSMRLVLVCTFSAAFVYSSVQGVLEFVFPSPEFRVDVGDGTYDLFGHGGMIFWMASSAFFAVVYITICILPFTNWRNRFRLPEKKSFYAYCGVLAVSNTVEVVASALLYAHVWFGCLCILDVMTYLYFAFFAPIVFFTFLWDFFSIPALANLLRYTTSYKSHDEDDVSLPYSAVANAASTSKVMEHRRHLTSNSGLLSSTEIDAGDTSPLYDANHLASQSDLSIDYNYYGSTPDLTKLPIA